MFFTLASCMEIAHIYHWLEEQCTVSVGGIMKAGPYSSATAH